MKKLIGIAVIALVCSFANAQEIRPAFFISDSLRENASVVKRYERIEFEVPGMNRARLSVHRIITVMNEKGKNALVFQEYTDRYQSVDDVQINVFDAAGKKQGSYSKKDLQTYAIGEGLIGDGYVLYFRVPSAKYPLTVEYRYERKMKGTLFYPSYHILDPGESVEQSSFVAKISIPMDIRYKNRNIEIEPDTFKKVTYTTYTWKVSNLKARYHEEGALNDYARYPTVLLAPKEFQYDDYKGSLDSWKSLGLWYNQLYRNMDVLPPHTVTMFRNMVADAPDDREKARRIYKYLQQNFRYVSIQLGIGGLKPFSAEETDEKKYGDCKALSNYMKAALKSVGIKSYAATINAGENMAPMDPEFPSKISNHVILCLPLEKDTVWLECTSKTTDFGVLGSFTENRNALLLTDEGGVLVATPKSNSSANKFCMSSSIQLMDDGSGLMQNRLSTTGEYAQVMRQLVNEKKESQKSFAVFGLGFKLPEEFSMKPDEQGFVMDLRMDKIPEFIAGSRMFLAPRLYKMWSKKLEAGVTRTMDYYFSHPFIMTDTTMYKLPESLHPDALPEMNRLSNEFAEFTSSYSYDKERHTILTTAKLELYSHKIPAKDYEKVRAFFDKVLHENDQRIVLKKASPAP